MWPIATECVTLYRCMNMTLYRCTGVTLYRW
jgi:hypothetical protein